MTEKPRIGIIVGSTRPGRVGGTVAHWVLEQAQTRGDAEYTLLDLADFNLPLLDEPELAFKKEYHNDHTRKWAEAVDACDAFVMVTPEYNHSTSGALKNAIDFLYHEWNNKCVAFVGYGWTEGVRAVEHLRQIVANLHMHDVRDQGGIHLAQDVDGDTMTPRDIARDNIHKTLEALVKLHHGTASLRN